MLVDITVAPLSETRPNDTKNAGFGLFRCANRAMDSLAAGAGDVPEQGKSEAYKSRFFFQRDSLEALREV